MEEQKEIGNLKIGKEQEKLEAKKVKIENVEVKNFEEMNDKINLICSHPDTEKLINISKATIKKGDKLKTMGLWLSLDQDGSIAYDSTLANILRFYKADNVNFLIGLEVETNKENDFLVLKAY